MVPVNTGQRRSRSFVAHVGHTISHRIAANVEVKLIREASDNVEHIRDHVAARTSASAMTEDMRAPIIPVADQ